ncbi:DUF2339 domain-containing protein [Lysobacter auxotrophicus]|uniref:DUF2339 domain-containing protein n=1 Tax=Lysobacter auxotrophicus TaxID=2992573 RepID=A0ABN6UNE6_9GAMM|nr:DUF2339 domain-containing protein [Lysobacter auxotrophicus]BDU17915.1 DUF2339 domain-containing protein [Lysobacter auxotrophicus]
MEGLLVLVALAVLAVPVLLIVALVSLSGVKVRVADLERQLDAMRRASAVREAASAPPREMPLVAPVPPPMPAAAPPPVVREAPIPTPKPKPGELPEAWRAEQPAPEAPRTPPPRARVAPARPDAITMGLRMVQRWFMTGNVPVKIGILVLFAGVASLLKYASDQGWMRMPIELRLAGIAAASLAALVFAWRKREHNRVFALSLQGGAIGILLLTVFAAFKLYGLLDAGPEFALSVLLVAGAGALAVLQDAKALAVFALLAGFLAPIWLSTGSGNHVALFSYYAVLNLAVAGVAWWKSWRLLNVLGFAFTFGIGALWGVSAYQPEKFATTEPFLLLFFAIYLAIPLLHARRQPEGRRGFVEGCLMFGTPLVAFSMQAGLLEGDRLPLAFNALGLAAIYALLAAWLRRREGYGALTPVYALLAVGFATLAVPLALSARATASVFALEGAGLVWLGLRQQRRWPQLGGMLLQFLAAYAFGVGAAVPVDDAIANPVFMSALLIALAGFAIAWSYRNRSDHDVFATAFYLWGLVWWLGNAVNEVERFVMPTSRADVLLAVIVVTGWLAAEVQRRRPATALAWTTLGALVAAAPIAWVQTQVHGHPFAGHGGWSWLVYAVLGVRSLVCLRASAHAIAARAQFVWLLVWPLAISLLLEWLSHRFALAGGWRVLGLALPWCALAAMSLFRWSWLSAPLGERFDSSRTALQATCFAVLAFGWLLALFSAHGGAPLPWIPLLNPLELAQLAVLVLLARWLVTDDAPDALRRLRPITLSLAGFALVTACVLRTVNHWGGVAWTEALLHTSLAQTSLSVTWSVLGVIGWVLGSRRGQRGLWLAGAVLMGVVLAKLLLVDRGNLGNGLGIASFIAYGLLCTVVGYIAPVPPRHPSNADHAETEPA